MPELDGCRVCGLVMEPGAGARERLYCSEPCKNRAKWERRKAVYQAERAAGMTPRMRAYQTERSRRMGVRPQRTGTLESCRECGGEFEGVLGKRYCTVTCREAAADRRERQRAGLGETVLSGTASLFGAYAPKAKPIKVRIAVGALAFCPWCDSMLAAASDTHRACRSCGTTAELNEEEVAWAISEAHSTRTLQPTAN